MKTLALAAAFALFANSAALAETKNLEEKIFDDWTTIMLLDDNAQVGCVATTGWTDRSEFYVKKTIYEAGWAEINAPYWQLTPDVPVTVRISIDGTYRDFPGTTFQYAVTKAWGIKFPVDDQFLEELAKGRDLIFAFPGSQERNWIGSTKGSFAAMTYFKSCIDLQNEVGRTNPPPPVNSPNPFSQSSATTANPFLSH